MSRRAGSCGPAYRQSRGVLLSLALGVVFSYVLSPYLNNDCSGSDGGAGRRYDGEAAVAVDYALKPSKAKKTLGVRDLVRPRYYSSELGVRERVLLGVLTRGSTVKELAVAVNRTAAHLVDKTLFFMDAAEASAADAPSLHLPGMVGFVDTKPVLKPFHALKYLTENYLEEYEYFVLTRDSVYLDARLVTRVLGEAGAGRHVHAGPLLAAPRSHFCSLDGGIVLSNSVLRAMAGAMEWCVDNAFSDRDDDNLGRCVLHATDLPCSQSIQGRALEGVVLPPANQLQFVSSQPLHLHRAFSYSVVKDPAVTYTLHYRLSQKRLSEMKRAVESVERSLKGGGAAWPPGSYPPDKPTTRFDLLPWRYWDLSDLYAPTGRTNVQPLSGPTLQDTQKVVETSVSWLIEKYRGEVELSYKRLVNGYSRFDPSRGLDYLLDLAFTLPSGRQTVKRVEVCKALGRAEAVTVPYVTENSRVTVLLPVRAESADRALTFLDDYSRNFMRTSELTFLLLILLYDPGSPGKGHSRDVFKRVKELAQDLTFKHRKDYSRIAWLSIKVPLVKGGPAPLYDDLLYLAMVDLAMKKLPPESLLLFSDPYVDLTLDYINRVRMNTIAGRLVFSPIPLSEYRPDLAPPPRDSLHVHSTSGHFNPHNIQHISFYTSDFFAARKNLSGSLPAVKFDRDIAALITRYDEEGGKAPGSLLELLSTVGGEVSVLRAPEPFLRVHHRSEPCDRLWLSVRGTPRSVQYTRCLARRDVAVSTRSRLASFLLLRSPAGHNPS